MSIKDKADMGAKHTQVVETPHNYLPNTAERYFALNRRLIWPSDIARDTSLNVSLYQCDIGATS